MTSNKLASRELSAAELKRESEIRVKSYEDTVAAIKALAIAAFLIWFGFG